MRSHGIGWRAAAGVGFAAWSLACGDPAPTPEPAGTPQAPQHPLSVHLGQVYDGGLERVLERRFLRVLTSKDSFDYFIHGGEPGGYQYEMVRAFVRNLNAKHTGKGELPIQFELLPVSADQLEAELLAGRGDMIAARLPRTDRQDVRFSVPYAHVDEVVITSRDPRDFPDARSLAGQRFAVQRSSQYHRSLVEWNAAREAEGLGAIEIVPLSAALEGESVLGLVAAAEYDFTVADSLIADLATRVFDSLRVLPVTLLEDAPLAWATAPESRALAEAIDAFLPTHRQGSRLGNLAIRKYFDAEALARRDGHLSPYDDYIRKYSAAYDFDWRLMAAVAYQESRFHQEAENPSGATGLFQIKPKTARESYVDIPEIAGEKNAENNVHAGVKYLAWIRERYFAPLPDMRERNRIRMTLAAYNTGPAALFRARERAQELGLDPNRWFRNVELALLDMDKPEPVKYVSEINKRYVSYVLLGVESYPPQEAVARTSE